MIHSKKYLWKKVLYFIPIPLLFCSIIKYIFSAIIDLPALNDYIRLINNLVGEGKFRQCVFSPAVVTSAPIALFSTWINIRCFGLSVYYDLILGALGLMLIAAVLYKYILKHEISLYFYSAVLICIFSLNKWEMILNGTGWAHFWTFAAFYFYYLYIDQWYVDQEQSRRNKYILIVLPVITILGIAVFYAAVFSFVISLMFCIIIAVKIQKKENIKNEIVFLLSIDIPMLVYVFCSILQNDIRIVADGSLLDSIAADPLFLVKMFTASFSSEIIGVETVLKYNNGIKISYILGIFVMVLYGAAIYWNLREKMYRKSYMPLILLSSGICNHIIVVFTRWGFHNVTYGMSSRYELQYLEGLLGIVLTAALSVKNFDPKFRAGGGKFICYFITMVLSCGSLITTYDELEKIPHRIYASKQAEKIFFTYESYSDDELKEIFVAKDGRKCREALELLKKYRLSVWEDIGSDLKNSYKVYGVYEDNWLEKRSKIITYAGEKENIIFGFYLPENSLVNMQGERNIEFTINGKKYIRSPQEGTFELIFKGIEDEFLDIEINAGFTLPVDGGDLREKSLILYSMECQ